MPGKKRAGLDDLSSALDPLYDRAMAHPRKPKEPQHRRPRRKPRVTFIAYVGHDEVLVTTPTLEKRFVVEWFDPINGREQNDYERRVTADNGIKVLSRTFVQFTSPTDSDGC